MRRTKRFNEKKKIGEQSLGMETSGQSKKSFKCPRKQTLNWGGADHIHQSKKPDRMSIRAALTNHGTIVRMNDPRKNNERAKGSDRG